MKLSILSLAALSALVVSTFASPAPASSKPKKIDQAYAIVSTLYTNVQQYTGAINTTAASLSSSSTAADNATAAAAFQDAISQITSLVTSATTQVKAIKGKRDIVERQATVTPTQLANLVTNFLLEISGSLNNVINTLGLANFLSFLNPLTTALSNLLLALVPVVNNLLELVRRILNGLLIGLSAALAGLVL